MTGQPRAQIGVRPTSDRRSCLPRSRSSRLPVLTSCLLHAGNQLVETIRLLQVAGDALVVEGGDRLVAQVAAGEHHAHIRSDADQGVEDLAAADQGKLHVEKYDTELSGSFAKSCDA